MQHQRTHSPTSASAAWDKHQLKAHLPCSRHHDHQHRRVSSHLHRCVRRPFHRLARAASRSSRPRKPAPLLTTGATEGTSRRTRRPQRVTPASSHLRPLFQVPHRRWQTGLHSRACEPVPLRECDAHLHTDTLLRLLVPFAPCTSHTSQQLRLPTTSLTPRGRGVCMSRRVQHAVPGAAPRVRGQLLVHQDVAGGRQRGGAHLDQTGERG